jgi:hypothetical protein
LSRKRQLALRFCITAFIGLPGLCHANMVQDQEVQPAGHHHVTPAKQSRLLKPGTILPNRVAPATALHARGKVVLVDAVEDHIEAPRQIAAPALPVAVAPRISLLPHAPFKPVAIAR